jgi:hypothetical protein
LAVAFEKSVATGLLLNYDCTMSTVAEIESAIEKLDPKEIRRVGDWLNELRERLFDERIEADAKAGKLDKLMEEAKQDYLAGRCKPLP